MLSAATGGESCTVQHCVARPAPTDSRLVRKLLHTLTTQRHQNYAKYHQKHSTAEYRNEPSAFFGNNGITPVLHSVRRRPTYATEMRKRIYASHARKGVYTPRVDLGAYTQTSTQYRYHFREMDLFYMSRKTLRIRIGCGLLTNDNPASTRKRRRIGLYRENAIAIQNESGDSNGGNV